MLRHRYFFRLVVAQNEDLHVPLFDEILAGIVLLPNFIANTTDKRVVVQKALGGVLGKS